MLVGKAYVGLAVAGLSANEIVVAFPRGRFVWSRFRSSRTRIDLYLHRNLNNPLPAQRHWIGQSTQWTVMMEQGAEGFAMHNALRFYLPVIYSDRAAATSGMPATSCLNAAWTAFK